MKEFLGLKRRFDQEQKHGHKRHRPHREDKPESSNDKSSAVDVKVVCKHISCF